MDAQKKLLRQAADAVFNIDPDELKQILTTAFLGDSDLHVLGVMNRCWDTVLRHVRTIWPESMQGRLKKRIAQNDSIGRQLENFHCTGLPQVRFSLMDTQPEGPDKDNVYRRFFGAGWRDLHDEGYWESDLKMYLAVDRFNLHRVESLLRAGASPRTDVPHMTDNCYNILDSESMVLIIRLQPVIGGERRMKCTDENFRFLYYLAGLFKMRDLMERYDPEG